MTFETPDQSDEEKWPDQKKHSDKDKYKDKDSDKAKLLTCDTWDTDYNFENWEPEFMIIFVTWQLRVTLDSIRNSCDVLTQSFHSISKTGISNINLLVKSEMTSWIYW